jgi:hypothetical protein
MTVLLADVEILLGEAVEATLTSSRQRLSVKEYASLKDVDTKDATQLVLMVSL